VSNKENEKKKTSIRIFDFSTIYITIPFHDIAEILQMLALNINKPITTIPHEHGKLNN
jgi:hypothetical protein